MSLFARDHRKKLFNVTGFPLHWYELTCFLLRGFVCYGIKHNRIHLSKKLDFEDVYTSTYNTWCYSYEMQNQNNSVSEFQLLTDNNDPDEVVKLSFSQRRKLILTIVILVVVIVLLCIALLSVFFIINKKCNENKPKGKLEYQLSYKVEQKVYVHVSRNLQ